MAERLPIIESADSQATILDEIAAWGPLEDINRHDSGNEALYENLVAAARDHVKDSLVAAALVSAWNASDEIDPYDYGGNLQAALTTAETVRSIQEFHRQHPSGEIGLHVGAYQMILFQTAEMELETYYMSGHGAQAYMTIKAPLQTGLTLYSGQIDPRCQVSNRRIPGVRGGYNVFSVTFNEIGRGVMPALLHHRVDPLRVGRQQIADYFDTQARLESLQGGTTHRLSSLAHGIWRLRCEDPGLAATVDSTAERYGLPALWAKQYRREIGSKAAHVLLSGLVDQAYDQPPGQPRTEITLQEELLMQVPPRWASDEAGLYGTNPALYLPAACQSAARLGIAAEVLADGKVNPADEAALRRAIEYVFRPVLS